MSSRERKRRTTLDGPVEAKLKELEEDGWGATQIYKELVKKFGEASAPHLRTVQNHLKVLRPDDATERWTLMEADEDEVAACLPILRGLWREFGITGLSNLTNGRAEWVARVHRWVPELKPKGRWRLASEYWRRSNQGKKSAEDLDVIVADRPWEDLKAMKTHWAAMKQHHPADFAGPTRPYYINNDQFDIPVGYEYPPLAFALFRAQMAEWHQELKEQHGEHYARSSDAPRIPIARSEEEWRMARNG